MPSKGGVDGFVWAAYEKDVPIFCPAFSDCSAGFGFVAHQHERQGKPMVSLDSGKDFYELTKLKIENPTTGLLMLGWRCAEELRAGHCGGGRCAGGGCLRCTSMRFR